MSGRRTPCCDNSCYSAGKKYIKIYRCDNPKCLRSGKDESNWWCDACTDSAHRCPSCGETAVFTSNAG